MSAPGLAGAFRCEWLKARRSRVPLLTGAGFSIAPAVGGLFMVILMDPERARDWGLITTKAQVFAGSADWPTFLGLLAQTVAIGGPLLFAIVTAWVFGREFADRTVKTLLALPTPRTATVAAKMLVVVVVSALMVLWVVALGLGIGAALRLPGGSGAVLAVGLARICLVAVLGITLLTPIALAASVGRGYIAPLGMALLLLFLAQITAAMGWGEWFPWAVGPLLSGSAGPDAAAVGAGSYVVVLLMSGAGAIATFAWWQRADHT